MLPIFPFLDTAAAVERMGDEEIYLEIARFFADRLDSVLTDLETALGATSMEEATRLAHSLKGNCATIGADKARDLSASLEQLCRQGEREAAQELFTGMIPLLQEVKSAILTL